MPVQENTFAEACYDQNSIEELEVARNQEPDETDMKEWNLTEDEWREQIEIAIAALKEDAEETKARRESWNGFIRSLINRDDRIDGKDQPKIYARAKEQGWDMDELKKAIQLHILGPAK